MVVTNGFDKLRQCRKEGGGNRKRGRDGGEGVCENKGTGTGVA